jgi:hypothetical protein
MICAPTPYGSADDSGERKLGAQLAAICPQWSSVPNEKRSIVAALRYTASAIQELRGYITI